MPGMNRKTFLQWLGGIAAFGTPSKMLDAGGQPSAMSLEDLDPSLLHWLRQPRIPVLEAVDEKTRWLIAATLNRWTVDFVYTGGSEPGRSRTVSPGLVFRVDSSGPVYIQGYCHVRNEERVFRVEHILPGWIMN